MGNHGSRPLRKLLALSLISSGGANELVKQFYTDFINAYVLEDFEAFKDFMEGIDEVALSLLSASDGLSASTRQERLEAFRNDPHGELPGNLEDTNDPEELPGNLHDTLRTLPRWFSDETLTNEARDLSEYFVYYSSSQDFQNANYPHPFTEKHLPVLENLVTRRFTTLTAKQLSPVNPHLAEGKTATWRWIVVSLFYISCRFVGEVLLYTELMKFHYGNQDQPDQAWTEKHETQLGGNFPLTDDDMVEFGHKIQHLAGVVHGIFCAAALPSSDRKIDDCEYMTETGNNFWQKILGEKGPFPEAPFPHKTLVTTFRNLAYEEEAISFNQL